MNVLEPRNAFADYAHVPSQLRWEAGASAAPPLVTIAIPTFRRAALLRETLDSAIFQRTQIPFEIVIVDNDPDPEATARTIAMLPPAPPIPVRYFVNEENIGMFPNWNRGIELARGDWVSVLNDDDLLLPDFLERMVGLVQKRTEIDGVVAETNLLDRRPQAAEAGKPSLPRRAWRRFKMRRYDADGLVRIESKSLFFGNELSSTLAFIFKRDIALALGGFLPEDWPSADYLFYARFAFSHKLFLLRDELGLVGIGENESMRPETLHGFMIQGDRLRRSLAGAAVPREWLALSPLIVSTAIAETEAAWRVKLDRKAIAEELALTLPKPSRVRLNLERLRRGAL